MKKTKLAVWPFVTLCLLLVSAALTLAWSFDWWGWVLPWQILSISAIASAFAIALSSLCYWLFKINRSAGPTAEQLAEKERVKALKRSIASQFEVAQKHSQGYKKPWYLLFAQSSAQSRELLLNQGFEPVIEDDKDNFAALSFWRSDQAVVVSVEQFESGYFEESIESLTRLMAKHRARQGANAVLLAMSTLDLVEQRQSLLNDQAKRWRSLLQRFNKVTGLNLPSYLFVTDFSALGDLQRLFSCFNDDRLEQPLGALNPTVSDGFDEQWFEQSFSQIHSELLAHTTLGLKAQLNPQYRDSILTGPYQFGLLKAELVDFLRQLFSDNAISDQGLNFRGYFFNNDLGQANRVDKLTMLLCSQLGYQQFQQSEQESGRSLFSKGLFKQAVLPEAAKVGVNVKRERGYRFWALSFSCLLLAGLIAFAALLKLNNDYYVDLNQQALAKLTDYKRGLLADPPNVDDLTGPIFSLSDLNAIRQLYRQQKPWYVLSVLPNPSIEQQIESSYQQAIEQILLSAMRDYLLKDMFVYNKLEDKLKTIEYYNLYQLLFNAGKVNKTPLIDYFVSSLQAEGHSDIKTLEAFREVLSDALRPGVIPEPGEQALIGLIKSSLSQDDISELLYQHLLQRPQMRERVDLRQSLGQKAQLVFNFSQSSAYFIPRIFTRDGFEQLLKADDFELATTALVDFEGVVGKVDSASQISRVNRELKQRYISDYIDYWQKFYASVQWAAVEDSQQARNQLQLMADETFSPLKVLQELMSRHTDLSSLIQAQVTQEGGEQSQVDLERNQIGLQMAAEIARPFTAIHSLLKKDDQGVSPIDAALNQSRQADQWLEAALVQQPQGSGLLEHLSTAASVNPLQQMQDLAANYQDPLIVQYLNSGAQELNNIAMLQVRAYLNEQWNRNVYQFYRTKIAGFYPFSKGSSRDVSTRDFNRFFAADGIVDSFSQQFLGYFDLSVAGQPNMRTFLASTSEPFNDDLIRFLSAVKDVRQRMYSAGALKVDFAIRAKGMSSELSEIALYSERKIYSYRNGPPLWANVQWPRKNSQNIELQLKSVNKQLLRANFDGLWSWFRLADATGARFGEDPSVSLLQVHNQGQTATLILRVENDKTPFIAGYFRSVRPPSAL